MTVYQLGKVVGADGEDAPKIESIEKTSTSGLVDTYTITLENGDTYTFDVTNGEDGSIVEVTQVVSSGTKIATLTIDGVDTDLFSPSGGSADIVTSWESTLSDTKVPSEKLTKETIDTKISKSQTAGLVKNDGTIDTTSYVSDISGKQDLLVSGTNIKTINNNSLLGSGNITVSGGASTGTFTDLQTLITNASSGDVLTLDKDYKYDSTTDSSLITGVTIGKTLTIHGNGHIIDGNSTARGFIINQQTVNIDNLIIQNCSTTGDENGGAIHINKSTINLTNCTFLNNSAKQGGAILIFNNTTGNIVNCTFLNNSSRENAGAVLVSDYNTVNIENCKFLKNSSVEAGALYGFKGNTVVIKDSLFTGNSANKAGAIMAYNYTTLNLINTDVLKNSAINGNGGGISSEWACTLNMNASRVYGNTATGSSANINSNNAATVYNCTLSDNASTYTNVTNYNDVSSNLIVDNLTTDDATKVLSAKQGKVLYDLISGVEEDMLL